MSDGSQKLYPQSSLHNSQAAPLKSPLSPSKYLYNLGEEPGSHLSFMSCCPPSQKECFNSEYIATQHTATESFGSHSSPTNTHSLLWACRMNSILSCLYGGKPRPGFYCPSPVTGWHMKQQLLLRALGWSFQLFSAYHVPSTTLKAYIS